MAESAPGAKEHSPDSRKRKRGWFWGAVALAMAVAVFLWFRHSSPQPQRTPPPPIVSTALARIGDIGVYVNAIGLVTPEQTVKITSFATGQLLSARFREGQPVQKGDLLLEIDPAPYEAQLLVAQGQYERDQALLASARRDLERYQLAYTNHSIPRQQLENQLSLVRQTEGTLKLDLGQVRNAEVGLAYTKIHSPVTGRVGLRLVDPGNAVTANSSTGLVFVVQTQPISVIFSVPEDYLPQIQAQKPELGHMQVEVFDRAWQRKLATGFVLAIDNQIDLSTGTFRIRARFGNEDEALFPNQFVNARLLIELRRGVTLVPAVAVQLNPQGAFVYVVTPQHTVSARKVMAGTTDEVNTAVTGVNPAEAVVTDNFNRIQDGARVVPRNAAQQKTGDQEQAGGSG